MTLVKESELTLFRGTTTIGFVVREMELNSEYGKKKWELIAEEQGGGSMDGKFQRGKIKARGLLARPTQQDSC